MTKRKKLVLSAMLVATTVYNASAQVAQALQEQEQEAKSIGESVVKIILGIIGSVALVQAFLIFIGSGTGEEKIKKAGTYLFMLVFVAFGYYLSTKLFN